MTGVLRKPADRLACRGRRLRKHGVVRVDDQEALAIKRVLAGQLESVTQQFTNCDTLSTH